MNQPRLFFTSDQHFFHKNIIKYGERPFTQDDQGVQDSIEYIVNKHNSIVGKNDVVVWVGDISMHKPHQKQFLQKVVQAHNGKKILIKGNHDKESNHFYGTMFDRIIEDYVIIDGYVVCHYPCTLSKYSRKSEISIVNRVLSDVEFQDVHTIIHGHTHQRDANQYAQDGIRRLNVCVDFPKNNFEPVEIDNKHLLEYFIK